MLDAMASPIYAAANLSCTIRGRTTLGLLTALTGGNDVEVLLADGQTHVRRLVDPYTLYSAARRIASSPLAASSTL